MVWTYLWYFYESNSVTLRFTCHKYQNQFRCVVAMSNFFSERWVLAKYLRNWFWPTKAETSMPNWWFKVEMSFHQISSDESELSWRIFSSAWLVIFFHSARNRKSAENEPKFVFCFLNNYFSEIGLKMIKLCT